jgi:hypothetical protein
MARRRGDVQERSGAARRLISRLGSFILDTLEMSALCTSTRVIIARRAQNGDDLVMAIKASLLGNTSAAAAALEDFPLLRSESAVELIPTPLRLALSVHGLTESARSCLARLPSAAVVEAAVTIETDVIRNGDYEEYACLIEIWRALDHTERALRLAERASKESNEDVRDVALSFLQAHGAQRT